MFCLVSNQKIPNTAMYSTSSSSSSRPASSAPPQRQRPFTVALEGNIGVGKSTLVEYIKTNATFPVLALAEPVSVWRDVAGVNLLDKMYSDPKRWGFTFQTCVTLSMLENHTAQSDAHAADKGLVKVLERSIHSARNCFVEIMKKQGTLDAAEVHLLDRMYNLFAASDSSTIDMVVYLRADPAVVHKRILARGRAEESAVDRGYLNVLHDAYESWLGPDRPRRENDVPLVVLDSNLDRDRIVAEYDRALCEISKQHHRF